MRRGEMTLETPYSTLWELRQTIGLEGDLSSERCSRWVIGLLIAVTVLLASQVSSQTPPSEKTRTERRLPEGELGKVIKLGEELVAKTVDHPLSKKHVGNRLNCTSCHLDNGRHPTAASFQGVATAYPAWSPREKRIITLEDRVLNCFMRSCNGVRPPTGSQLSVAIAAYISWLSEGEPLWMNAKAPKGPNAVRPLKVSAEPGSLERGGAIYARKCAECHGENGAGDDTNPPVWGSSSYNSGAGFAQADQLAAWIKVAMPLDDANLSEQEAIDVAVFINSHERPRFELKEHLPDAAALGEYNAEP